MSNPGRRAAGASYWLPARNVSLQATLESLSLEAHVGDPITVDLKLQADGLTAAQLPDLSALLKLPSGLKAYPDQPNLKDDHRDRTSSAPRSERRIDCRSTGTLHHSRVAPELVGHQGQPGA